MQKYLKDYAVYLEDYDRETISQLKELEQSLGTDLNDPGSAAYQTFLTLGIKRERQRSDFIMAQMDQARQMDLLVERTKRPAVNCQVCGVLMEEDGHTFRNDNRDIAFFFQCPQGHSPKRLFYADGKREITFPIKHCTKCGGGINSVTEETELELIFIDTCTRCGNVARMEMSMELPVPINEAERKQYCTDFIGKTTQLEELSALLEVVAEMKEHSGPEPVPVKSKPVPQLEQLNIPELESRVTACLEKAGFIKVVFQVPRMDAQVLIDLTLQDPSNRPETTSLRLFKKQMNELLSPTNWRLAKEVGYRMGMISAQLVGYDKKEDLLRLAKGRKK